MDKNYVSEMLLALEANIEYLRQEGDSQIRIRNGKLTEALDDSFIYEFELDFFQNIEPDAEVEIRIGNGWASGQVISINEKKIQIELEKSVGQIIPEARLVISSYYLLQLLHDKLQTVLDGSTSLTGFEKKVFALEKSKIALVDYKIPASKSDPPNSSQGEAISLALGSETSFIWGPPGTGKTKTIARIIEGFVSKGQSVLLISHTNVATDGALLATVKHLKPVTDDYDEGKFVREGSLFNKELKDKFPLVIKEKIVEKKASPIVQGLNEVQQKKDTIHTQLQGLVKILEQLRLINELDAQIKNLQEYVENQKASIGSAQQKIATAEKEIELIDQRITKFNSSGALGKMFSGTSLNKLMRQKTEVSGILESARQNVISGDEEVGSSINKLNVSITDKAAIERELEKVDIKHALSQKGQLEKDLKDLEAERLALQKQLDELTINIIKEAKVVATTLTKSYSSKVVLSREYDCVILDEASMAPLPAVWFASGLAKKHVVIVGDFLQLPPIAKHKVLRDKTKPEQQLIAEETAVNKWLKKDIFEIAGISSAIDRGESPEQLRQLKTQYRMHPDIGDVVNFLVYERKSKGFGLEHGDNTHKNGIELLSKEPLKKFHVGVYDTSNIGTVPTRTDSGSYYNLYQALLSVELAKKAIDSGYLEIGIISPFRAQTNLIQKMVKDLGIEEFVEADTVHRFQGGEKQIVIFDISTSLPTKLTDDQEDKGDDEKLINVAFSRAREKLVIVGDVSGINKKHSLSSLIRKFFDYSLNHNFPFIAADDILPQFSVTQAAERWMKKIHNVEQLEKDIENSSLFDQKDFYPQFLKDLFEAKKEVVIDSPFITKQRSQFFLPVFKILIDKGVNIFVLTRQSKEHDEIIKQQASEAMKEFEEMGVIVLPFKGMVHRKLAIIDREILWEGSLNILSQRESQEIMRRFQGKDTAKQMITFLKLDKNIGLLGENNLKQCPHCEGPGAWFWTDKGLFGQWTFCLIGGHAENKLPKTDAEKKAGRDKLKKLRKSNKEITESGAPICPEHDLAMIRRKGRFGEFWGCPKFPRCRVTHKIS